MGHEDWVHSVAWQPPRSRGNAGEAAEQPLCVLSASMDRTMMLWRPDPDLGAPKNRVTTNWGWPQIGIGLQQVSA